MPHEIRHLLFIISLLSHAVFASGASTPGQNTTFVDAPDSVNINCEAAFLFTHVDGHTYTFYNTSSNYDFYQWDFAGDLVTPDPGLTSATYTFSEDTNQVCIYIFSLTGCTDTLCLDVYPGSPDEMCNVTDCVWPGDANGNLKANNYDLLNIGLGFGQTGPMRPFYPNPDNPIEWAPNFGFNWMDSAGPVNFKHLDCDGDGIVDEMDLLAIELNYVPEVDVLSQPTPQAPPIYLEFDQTEITITEDLPDSIVLTAHLILGSDAQPFDDAYGLAFNFSYDEELVFPNSITYENATGSFMGSPADVISLGKDLYDFNTNRYDYALSRKDGQGASGNGTVATFSLIVSGDIIEGKIEPEIPVEIGIDDIILRNAAGDTLEYSLSAPAVVTFINNSTLASDHYFKEDALQTKVFPNPANDWVNFTFSKPINGTIQLYDARGSLKMEDMVNGNQSRMNIATLPRGLYFAEISTTQLRDVHRILVE
jgi:hypothetical protein